MFTYRRPVRFAEVDAARLVFFARVHEYCHDALEAFFAALPGGYAHLIQARDIGIPTVHISTDFTAPLRYGDVAVFDVEVLRIGRTSVTFRHTVRREADGAVCAVIRQVVVTTKLATLEPVPVPADVRALVEAHLIAGETNGGQR